MSQLFGTDGIRGMYGEYPITQEIAFRLGFSMVGFCKKRELPPHIIMGRDTRGSGQLLEYALISGIMSGGGVAKTAGVLPTPGVAFLVRKYEAGAGIVLSASHNPHEYNGFKIFTREGFKLNVDEEKEIVDEINDKNNDSVMYDPGRVEIIEDASEKYLEFLVGTIPQPKKSLKLVVDCSNGATYRIAPRLFDRLGLRVKTLFNQPDGNNINLHCGSQHTETLSKIVLETSSDLGLAFDGDGDRLIAVDENGKTLTGDQVIAICARFLQEKGDLKNNIVVSTVMSNMGLNASLKGMNIEHVSSAVGDRYVVEEMKKRNGILGGEDSGHIVFLNQHTTGDGMLTALQLLAAIEYFDDHLSGLSGIMIVYPQTLINVPVKRKPDMEQVPVLAKTIKDAKKRLNENGRILVRYSGTEPICRVMVEGKDQHEIEKYAHIIAEIITKELNT